MVTSNKNDVAERFAYNGKENNPELGLEWYDFSARNYDVALGRWMNIDPLADSFVSWSPYNFNYDNPIRFIDPTGLGPEDVILTGEDEEAINSAFEQLQASVAGSLTLSKDDDGNVTITEVAFGPLTEEALQLMGAINDHSIVSNINVTTSNTPSKGDREYFVAGAFLGNKETNRTTEDGVKIIDTFQDLNPNDTNVADETSGDYGATVLHEITESYLGGLEARSRGLSEVRTGTQTAKDIYDVVHPAAIDQSPINSRYYDADGYRVNKRVPGGSVRYFAPHQDYETGPTIYTHVFDN